MTYNQIDRQEEAAKDASKDAFKFIFKVKELIEKASEGIYDEDFPSASSDIYADILHLIDSPLLDMEEGFPTKKSLLAILQFISELYPEKKRRGEDMYISEGGNLYDKDFKPKNTSSQSQP